MYETILLLKRNDQVLAASEIENEYFGYYINSNRKDNGNIQKH